MSDSIFKEVIFTPHIFQKDNLMNDERKFERLLNTLENLAESGQIIGVFNDWYKFINENISEFDDFDKGDIEEVLKYLEKRQRIIFNSNKECNSNNENCWIEQSIKLNNIRNFEFILATEQRGIVKSFDSVNRKTLKNIQNKGAIVTPQSEENMQKLLTPILAYAEITKVYDPYFDISKQRYNDAIGIFSKTLGYRHGDKESAILEIHTSIKIILDKDNLINWKLLNQYSNKIYQLEKTYGHSIVFYIWEDKKDNKWHDRWIVTNQCAITLGKGTDISEWTDATWGLLDYEQISNVEKKFIDNRNEFNLIATIENNGIKKINKSNQYREPNTEAEIEEKLKKVKNFRNR